ncbi:MAG: hypothetical protein ABI203_11500 [Mucilaginibacter sp.]
MIFFLCLLSAAQAQSVKILQGIVFNQGNSIRLAGIAVVNKRTNRLIKTNVYGIFAIPAMAGDTISFSGMGYNASELTVDNFDDKMIFMQSTTQLNEVVIRENSLAKDLMDTQYGYRKKSVFYTGTPHYYYLFLKPMTFIYENFRNEVKEARKFKKFTTNSLNSFEVTRKWNNANIKANAPVADNQLEEFRNDYWPTLAQIRSWSDYDLVNYIKQCYRDFESKGIVSTTQ